MEVFAAVTAESAISVFPTFLGVAVTEGVEKFVETLVEVSTA